MCSSNVKYGWRVCSVTWLLLSSTLPAKYYVLSHSYGPRAVCLKLRCPTIPSNSDHKACSRGTLGVAVAIDFRWGAARRLIIPEPCLLSLYRGPADHINIRISHSGSKGQHKGDTRNHGLHDPHVYVGI